MVCQSLIEGPHFPLTQHYAHPQTHIPPAFYDRDGKFYQPPSFEMPVGQSGISYYGKKEPLIKNYSGDLWDQKGNPMRNLS